MKILVLTNGGRVMKWQLDAINLMNRADRISVLSLRNAPTNSGTSKGLSARLLKRLTLNNGETARVPIASTTKAIDSIREFDAVHDGSGQHSLLPDAVLAELKADPPDAILDFSSTLLRVPPETELPSPVLAYHFGEQSQFRSQFLGFYEVLNRTLVMVQTVQALSKSGESNVVASAETKVYPHSYKATMLEAYRHSKIILDQSLKNVVAGVSLPAIPTSGSQRTPSTAEVARLLLNTGRDSVDRLFYGALVQKNWMVSTATFNPVQDAHGTPDLAAIEPAKWDTPPVESPYIFYADPFFRSDGVDILVEALNGRSGKGEVIQIGPGGTKTLSDPGGHFSYPAVVEEEGAEYVVPETAQWSEPTIYRIAEGALEAVAPLKLSPPTRFVDGSFFWHAGRLYLFCSHANIGGSALYLWSSDSLFGEFTPHPDNPIRISPRGARMAGDILATDSANFRFGQDLTGGYGNGVYLFKIDGLSPETYREEMVGSFRFKGRRGPHTLNFSHGRVVFDWYEERLSPLAGVRRLKARM